jgi:ssDNA-binding Zn-finger/Zn-ribbon topoisomerase 1
MPRMFGAEDPGYPRLPKGAREDLRCVEPGCGGRLVLRDSTKFSRHFYSCMRWPLCEGSLPANNDGSPRGNPRPRSLQRARKAAHEAFDPIWKEGHVSRAAAYTWLQCVMDLTHQEAHMLQFSEEQCAEVVKLVGEKGPGTEFWKSWYQLRRIACSWKRDDGEKTHQRRPR